jgi:hypothetical protein
MLPEHVPDLSTLSEPALFSLYQAILSELKSRGVIRTGNAPAGDYAEYLVMTALGGHLAPRSEKSWDVLTNDGEKLQVKARVVSNPAKRDQLELSAFRSFGFDSAVIVLLSATDYTVSRASKVPRHVVESSAIYKQHVNGSVLFALPEIMGHPDATDLTATLRAAQTSRETLFQIRSGWDQPALKRSFYLPTTARSRYLEVGHIGGYRARDGKRPATYRDRRASSRSA